jgi:anti-sigma factor (TIGR02949 family)
MSKPDLSQQKETKKTCMELLQSILDGDATAEERQDFLERHLDACKPCYNNYNLEMAIRELLKTKCSCQEAPSDLVANIRNMINTSR